MEPPKSMGMDKPQDMVKWMALDKEQDSVKWMVPDKEQDSDKWLALGKEWAQALDKLNTLERFIIPVQLSLRLRKFWKSLNSLRKSFLNL